MTSADPAAAEPPRSSQLIRDLGVMSATTKVVGEQDRYRRFLVTSDMAHGVGSFALVFAAWILGGAIVLDATRLPMPAIALTVNLWFDRPARSTISLPVILAGIPFFYFKRSSGTPSLLLHPLFLSPCPRCRRLVFSMVHPICYDVIHLSAQQDYGGRKEMPCGFGKGGWKGKSAAPGEEGKSRSLAPLGMTSARVEAKENATTTAPDPFRAPLRVLT